MQGAIRLTGSAIGKSLRKVGRALEGLELSKADDEAFSSGAKPGFEDARRRLLNANAFVDQMIASGEKWTESARWANGRNGLVAIDWLVQRDRVVREVPPDV